MAITKTEFEALTPDDHFYIGRPGFFYKVIPFYGDVKAVYDANYDGNDRQGTIAKVTNTYVHIERWICHEKRTVKIRLQAINLKSNWLKS